jgi:hypothetical protein
MKGTIIIDKPEPIVIPYKFYLGDMYYIISLNKIMTWNINAQIKAKYLFYARLDENTDIKNMRFDKRIWVEYVLNPSKGKWWKPDTNNILCGIDKYLMDYLVINNCIGDDNSDRIKYTLFQTWKKNDGTIEISFT